MAAYASQAQFEAYVEGWVTDDAAALARYLDRATTQIDRLLGVFPVITTGTYVGRKLDPTQLRSWEADALADAVCAQAEYLIEVGDKAMIQTEPAGSVSGPDFSVTRTTAGGRPRYGAKVRDELARIAHLRIRGARAHA